MVNVADDLLLAPTPKALAGKHARLAYRMQSVPGQHWIGLDDMEFMSSDTLSADELAQCLFQLTGGTLGSPDCGETAHYYVHYDERLPDRLSLQVKEGCKTADLASCPFSIQRAHQDHALDLKGPPSIAVVVKD